MNPEEIKTKGMTMVMAWAMLHNVHDWEPVYDFISALADKRWSDVDLICERFHEKAKSKALTREQIEMIRNNGKGIEYPDNL